jgi:hypothetical protein
MKLIGIIVGAALLTAAPLSLQCTPRKAGLYIDTAEARVIHRRRPYYGYYGAPYYGAAAYPDMVIRLLTTGIRPTASRPILIPPIRRQEGSLWGLSDCLAIA